jgi:queuine tRNA-ribosyltransferase
MRFEILKEGPGEARRGQLHTRHGVVDTPVFMPVGTLGSVKSLDPRDMAELGARMCLANAYHLMLRPGPEIVARHGGLHGFCGYDGAILTDSGGFQVYSLSQLRRIDDHGVTFRSHIDGALIDLTPERLVEVQEALAPDVAMVLDECPPGQADRETVARAVARTTHWAERCLAARKSDRVAWFGIAQGALFDDMRRAHAATIGAMPFDGFAIGGVSVGEAPEEIARVVALTAPVLPRAKPRYLMGVGTPQDLVRGIAAGVDMFDCVMPSRNARNGYLFTSTGKIVIKNAEHRESLAPVDQACGCYTCKTFSRSFLRHLFLAKEITYCRLATIHNLAFYLGLMRRIRTALEDNTFSAERFLADLGPVEGAADAGEAEA